MTPKSKKKNPSRKNKQPPPLKESAHISITHFLTELDGEHCTDLHDMVMAQVEAPLLEAVMAHVKQNQSKAAAMLGLNRGTLRKKLRQYDLLDTPDNPTSSRN